MLFVFVGFGTVLCFCVVGFVCFCFDFVVLLLCLRSCFCLFCFVFVVILAKCVLFCLLCFGSCKFCCDRVSPCSCFGFIVFVSGLYPRVCFLFCFGVVFGGIFIPVRFSCSFSLFLFFVLFPVS